MNKRYTSITLPSYKYIPNFGPHPSKVKNIVHIPKLPDELTVFSELTWKSSMRYLYAIDLFNLGYYWEVHEVLEKLWLQLGKNSSEGAFIQGLIQLSVALLKHLQENSAGVERLSKKALAKLLSKNGVYLGIDILQLIKEFNLFIEKEQITPPMIFLNLDNAIRS